MKSTSSVGTRAAIVSAVRGRPASSLRVWVSTLILAGLALDARRVAGAEQSSAAEYEVKAAYVFNFANFVTWPASAFASPTAPMVIGVAGDSPIAGPLLRAIQGEAIGGRSLVIRRVARADDMKECHIVFVGANESRQLVRSLTELRNAPLLTIGDAEDFLSSGGMIRFVVAGNDKVRFDVNLDATSNAGLKPSARLLKVARRVFGTVSETGR